MRKNLLSTRSISALRQAITLILLFSLLGYSVLLAHSNSFTPTNKVNNPTPVSGESSPQGQKKKEKRKCPNCAPPGDQVIYTPLTDLPEAAGRELVFNSRSPQAMEVTPTFYKRDGTIIQGDPVLVQSTEIRYVNLKSLIPQRFREEHDWGGLSLSYYGGNREMWAQFRLLGVNGGSNVDEFFVVKDEQRADIQEAAWWMPEKSTAIIALGNITDLPTSATVNFGDGDSQTVNLAPHGTEIVRHKHDKKDGAESVAIKITGMPGSIVPTGLIASKDGSFNSVIRFYDTKRANQANLFATGLRLAGVTPHLTLKNTSVASITAQPKFITLDGLAAGAPVTLPDVTLSAGEATEVNLTPLIQAVRSRHDLDVVSVQIANSGEPGSLIGSLYGINNETGVNYDTPLRDSGPARSMTGTYPWKISDDFTTVVYITNISDQQAEFVTQLNYDGGKFIGNPGKLKPGETAVFDLQKIRDRQMKDNAGHTLSKEVSLGQFMWAVRGVTNGKLLLIGRAEMVSRSQHISTSYSCNNPCPPYYILTVDGFPGDFEVGESYSNMTAWETAYYDSGLILGPIASYPTWSVDDPIATFDPTGGHSTTMSCTAAGSTYMTAYAYTTENYAWDGLECIDQQSTYEVSETDPMEVVCAVPINFHQTNAYDVGFGTGTLQFVYAWDSSSGSGRLRDLSQCTMREVVTYNSSDVPFPSPFPAIDPENPTIISFQASSGSLGDTHSTSGEFRKPYRAKTITASQIYQYSCPCAFNGLWATIYGPPLSIVRSVSQNPDGSWKFTITKNGESATINPLP